MGHANLAIPRTLDQWESMGIVDLRLSVPAGHVSDMTHIGKFGANRDVDSAGPEDVWTKGGLYVPPTQDRKHAIVSTSVEDAGTLVSSGTVTSGTVNTIHDDDATFVSDGVSVGDIYLNDTLQDHSLVVSVDGEQDLTVKHMHHENANAVNNAYRVVTSAGTGIVVCHIKLSREQEGALVDEFVIMNGTTPVNTLLDAFRISRMHGHGVGANKTNVGDISATAAVDGTVTAFIGAGDGQTLMAIYSIPFGYDGFVTQYYANMYRSTAVAGAMAKVQLMSRAWGSVAEAETIEHAIAISIDGSIPPHNFNPYKKFSEGTDIWVRCVDITDNNTEVFAGFDVYLIQHDHGAD